MTQWSVGWEREKEKDWEREGGMGERENIKVNVIPIDIVVNFLVMNGLHDVLSKCSSLNSMS